MDPQIECIILLVPPRPEVTNAVMHPGLEEATRCPALPIACKFDRSTTF